MREVPEISVSRSDVVVDSISFRAPFLGLFGKPRWRICWRSTHNPRLRHWEVISRSCDSGSGELAGRAFSFSVRWRPDRRRYIGRRQARDVVTPHSVMQLADCPSREF